jgi:hypothetical protein
MYLNLLPHVTFFLFIVGYLEFFTMNYLNVLSQDSQAT